MESPQESRRALEEHRGESPFHGIPRHRGSGRQHRGRARGLAQLAAIGLILIMLGAIQKKVFVWKIGFWGGRAYGWHYDLMLVVMNLVIITTGGGKFVLR